MARPYLLQYNSPNGQANGGIPANSADAHAVYTLDQDKEALYHKLEISHQRPWDAAVKGSSALKAGLLSLLRDEMAIRLGMDSLVTLWDMEKFYDNIDILILVDEATKLEYLTMLLCLGLQMHMAPKGAQMLWTLPRKCFGQ